MLKSSIDDEKTMETVEKIVETMEKTITSTRLPLAELCKISQPNRCGAGTAEPSWNLSGIVYMCGESHFTFNGDIVVKSACDIIKTLHTCIRDHPGDKVNITITGMGGEAIAGEMVMGAIQTLRKYGRGDNGVNICPIIHTIASGLVASANANIWLMGDEKSMMPGSVVLLHHCQSFVGDVPVQTKGAKALDRLSDRKLAGILGETTDYPAKDWLELFDSGDDFEFSPEGAMMAGLATGVMGVVKRKYL